MRSLKVVLSALSGETETEGMAKPEEEAVVIHPGSDSGKVTISNTPTVTSSGQIIWSNRDLLFHPDRMEAAKIFEKNEKK
jgi:hypothetical protein